ncbi:MAG: hypothetical protein SFU27_11150 [Thermonemataceae bacterium]|nr:hypothetical protein [Thermonemataceae bacterium]
MNKKFVFSLLLFFLVTLSIAQQKSSTLLKEWQGSWKGTLVIANPEKKLQEIPMELHILPVDSLRLSWTIIYDKSPRAYELVAKEPSKGLFIIDEKNGIQMHAHLVGNTMISSFEVMESLLFSTYRLEKKQMIFEIISSSKKQSLQTGDIPEKEIPKVVSYPPMILQRAKLKKVK